MSRSLSEQELSELARAAEFVQRANADLERGQWELRDVDEETLRAIVEDRSRPSLSRRIALGVLMSKCHPGRGATLATLIPSLLDDPDEEVAEMAIGLAPRVDPEVTARLHMLLDDSRSKCWSGAAVTLATRRDPTIIPRLLHWFRAGDLAHHNVAWTCLYFHGLLDRNECRALLREAWDAGGRDDDDRVMLAVGLLGLDDRAGWDFLVEFARRADQYSACWAAETILERDPPLGLDLMLHVLDHGTTFQVRWGMVERIANAAGLPHVWTADGMAEARSWVEQQRLDPGRRNPMPNPV